MMDKPQWTRIFMRRKLVRMSGGVFFQVDSGPDDVMAHLPAGDHLLGVYAPSEATQEQRVYVAEQGIVFFEQGWHFLPYTSIARVTVDLAGSTKMAAERARIVRHDGTECIVTIVGGGPSHRDVFTFVGFLTSTADVHR
jgi:hypothetical protein